MCARPRVLISAAQRRLLSDFSVSQKAITSASFSNSIANVATTGTAGGPSCRRSEVTNATVSNAPVQMSLYRSARRLALQLSEPGSAADALDIAPGQQHLLYKDGSIGCRARRRPCDESSNRAFSIPLFGEYHYCRSTALTSAFHARALKNPRASGVEKRSHSHKKGGSTAAPLAPPDDSCDQPASRGDRRSRE